MIDSCSAAAAAAEVEAESEAQHFSLSLFLILIVTLIERSSSSSSFRLLSAWKKRKKRTSLELCRRSAQSSAQLSNEVTKLSSRQQTERTRGSSALVGAAVGRANGAQSIRYRSVRSSQRASVCSRGPKMFASAFACLPPLLSPTTTTSAVVFTLQSLIPPERSPVHVARSHQPPATSSSSSKCLPNRVTSLSCSLFVFIVMCAIATTVDVVLFVLSGDSHQ